MHFIRVTEWIDHGAVYPVCAVSLSRSPATAISVLKDAT